MERAGRKPIAAGGGRVACHPTMTAAPIAATPVITAAKSVAGISASSASVTAHSLGLVNRPGSPCSVARDARRVVAFRDPASLGGACGACSYRALCGGCRAR